jgi:STE24 endopeptidase
MVRFSVYLAVAAVMFCTIVTCAIPAAAKAETPAKTSQSLQADTEAATASEGSSSEENIYPLTPERKEKLHEYSTFNIIWYFFDTGFFWFLMLFFAFSGISAAILTIARKLFSKTILVFLCYLLLFLIIAAIISFPLDYYRGYLVEHHFGFSNQGFGGWFGDQIKEFVVTFVISAIVLGLVYLAIRRFPRRWWLVVAGGAIPLVIFFFVIAPVVIAPLFNDFGPLQNKDLETKILALADKAGIEGSHVFEVDASRQSTKLNAYVTGLFGTSRIVLYDTIIKALNEKELLFVMGHEMGHYVMHHVWIGAGTMIVFLLFAGWLIAVVLPRLINKFSRRLGFDSLSSFASVPLLLFAVSCIYFFVQPVTNGLSRHFEHEADVFAMNITDVPSDEAATAFSKLSAYNLSDPNPPALLEFWLYTHPSLAKRIAFVESYKRSEKQ